MAVQSKVTSHQTRWIAAAILVGSGVVSLAIGFDDSELSSYQFEFARLLLRLLGGAAIVAGGVRYLVDRERSLSWDKTRFIVDLFEDFDKDADCRRARTLIDHSFFSGDHGYVGQVLASGGNLSRLEWEDRAAIDRYLDFFDRLYTHVFITRTLSVEDVSSFSGYVTDIYKSPEVASFALEWGYEDVLLFAEAFDRSTEHRDREVKELRARLSESFPNEAPSDLQ